MHFIQKPQGGTWLAVQPHLSRSDLETQVKRAEVCLSDLDETDCHSPAKAIVLYQWHQRLIADKKYRAWLRGAIIRRMRGGREADSPSWKEYVDLFLKLPEARAQVQAHMNAEFVATSLYPGVADFYDSMSADKFYVTRNIPEVAVLYAERFRFRGYFGEIYNKAEFARQFVEIHPQFQHYIVRGDSKEDQQMLDELRSCQRSLKIKSLLGIYCAKSPLHDHHSFDVETSRDHTALVNLLKG